MIGNRRQQKIYPCISSAPVTNAKSRDISISERKRVQAEKKTNRPRYLEEETMRSRSDDDYCMKPSHESSKNTTG